MTRSGSVWLRRWLMQRRFALLRQLLPVERQDRLLEIGYGSGVFLPVLSQRCQSLYGIDIHDHHQEVAQQLERFGVSAELACGTAEALPYEDGFFDCLVAVSSLEFINDIDFAAREMRRVLKPCGRLVFVTPGRSQLLDFGLKIMTGESAKDDYGQRRERLLPALAREFEIDHQQSFPPIVSAILPVYTARSLRPLAQPRAAKPKPR